MPIDAFLQLSQPTATTITIPASAITGESQDTNHVGWIELQNFQLGVDNAMTIGAASSGAGAGKVKFQQFQVQKKIDATSPALYTMSAAGIHMPTVTLGVRKAGGASTPKDYLIFTFKLVFVTDITWMGGAGDEAPTESVTFTFGALQVSYAKQDNSGTLGNPTTSAWSVVTNTPTLAVQ
jgi:type VI secretion system secreted protein Hcp